MERITSDGMLRCLGARRMGGLEPWTISLVYLLIILIAVFTFLYRLLVRVAAVCTYRHIYKYIYVHYIYM